MNRRMIQGTTLGLVGILLSTSVALAQSDALLAGALLDDPGLGIIDVNKLSADIEAAVDLEVARLEERAQIENSIEDLREECRDEQTALRNSMRDAGADRASINVELRALNDRCEDELRDLREDLRDLGDDRVRVRVGGDVLRRRIAIVKERIQLEDRLEDVQGSCDDRAQTLQLAVTRARTDSARDRAEDQLASQARECEKRTDRLEAQLALLDEEAQLLADGGLRGSAAIRIFNQLKRERLRLVDGISSIEDQALRFERQCDARRDSLETALNRTSDADRQARLAASIANLEADCGSRAADLDLRMEALKSRVTALSGLDLSSLDLEDARLLTALR